MIIQPQNYPVTTHIFQQKFTMYIKHYALPNNRI
jgi:hypothetical protein